jgi:hypothetical protein
MSLPMFGEFVYRLIEGDLKTAIQNRFGNVYHRILGACFAGFLFFAGLHYIRLLRPFNPKKNKHFTLVAF